jgi:hypothetical protein
MPPAAAHLHVSSPATLVLLLSFHATSIKEPMCDALVSSCDATTCASACACVCQVFTLLLLLALAPRIPGYHQHTGVSGQNSVRRCQHKVFAVHQLGLLQVHQLVDNGANNTHRALKGLAVATVSTHCNPAMHAAATIILLLCGQWRYSNVHMCFVLKLFISRTVLTAYYPPL